MYAIISSKKEDLLFSTFFLSNVRLRDLTSLLAIGISISNLDNLLLFRILAASYRQDYNQIIISLLVSDVGV